MSSPSPAININPEIIPTTIKVLIVIAQYFIYFKALIDNSEKLYSGQYSLKALKTDTRQ